MALIKNNWSLKRTKTDLLWARRTSASRQLLDSKRSSSLGLQPPQPAKLNYGFTKTPQSHCLFFFLFFFFFLINLSPLLTSRLLYFSPVSTSPRPSTARSRDISGVLRGGGESRDEKHRVPQLPPIPDSPGKDSVSSYLSSKP